DLDEAHVVLVPALGAWAVTGGEGRRLVEKEQPCVPAGWHGPAMPAAKLEPAGDPALSVEAAADPALLVVQPASVSEHEPALGRRDQIAERRDPVLEGRTRPPRLRGVGGARSVRGGRDPAAVRQVRLGNLQQQAVELFPFAVAERFEEPCVDLGGKLPEAL